ncbi:fimbrial protein [Aquitalea sp. USM4]|uniref:fimbrial protein n=1 Tax=Aquitalea sp. USM4 TaxID=1590041 RepID=UPI00103F3FFD|nr:fimbrial protein [Aquitalea sp. USM4]QBJ77112.1 type 1 fimbrial protein [Aquitalea sp. USM4]
MKKLLTIASALALGGFATQAFAYDGTINFTGTISNVTCTLAVSGTTPGTITLPTVTQSALKAVGDTAGTTQFSIKLSACTGTPAPTQAAAWFETGAEVNAAGRLLTTVGGTATDTLSIALYNMGSATPIAIGQGNGSIGSSGSPFPITSGSATLNYQAKYYAEKTGVPAGAVQAKVNYTIQYQ